jgi:hypothetical protein
VAIARCRPTLHGPAAVSAKRSRTHGTQSPGQDHEPEIVADALDDARGYAQPAWTAGKWISVVLAFIVLAAAVLWLGQLLGLAAAVMPGGLDASSAAHWGGLNALGLGLLLLVVFSVRRVRRRREEMRDDSRCAGYVYRPIGRLERRRGLAGTGSRSV